MFVTTNIITSGHLKQHVCVKWVCVCVCWKGGGGGKPKYIWVILLKTGQKCDIVIVS